MALRGNLYAATFTRRALRGLTIKRRLLRFSAWGQAISPRGDMPKNRVRLQCEDARHVDKESPIS
jgi:hypothetical protein